MSGRIGKAACRVPPAACARATFDDRGLMDVNV
jgi:hypothetical protein